MKIIPTVDAVGHILCHDITQIIKDEKKDTVFRKGHVIKQEDIPVLLSVGKDNIYVWEQKEGFLHENDAANILYSILANDNISPTPVKEGKIDAVAEIDGLFQVDTDRLYEINCIEEIMIATRHTNFPVKKGDHLGGTRVIPLIIEEEKVLEAKKIGGDSPLMNLLPYKPMKVGIVTTGNEVFHGRIKDTFTDVIRDKISSFGFNEIGHITVPDNTDKISSAISDLKNNGAEVIVCTGGMSVDPDDLTPAAIKKSGANIITYGAPVLPGAMFLLGYFDDGTPIMGLPGCVMYAKATVFDIILPRIAAGVKVTKRDIAALGHGGYCLNCNVCTYPECGFGKSI